MVDMQRMKIRCLCCFKTISLTLCPFYPGSSAYTGPQALYLTASQKKNMLGFPSKIQLLAVTVKSYLADFFIWAKLSWHLSRNLYLNLYSLKMLKCLYTSSSSQVRPSLSKYTDTFEKNTFNCLFDGLFLLDIIFYTVCLWYGIWGALFKVIISNFYSVTRKVPTLLSRGYTLACKSTGPHLPSQCIQDTVYRIPSNSHVTVFLSWWIFFFFFPMMDFFLLKAQIKVKI